MGSAYEFYRTTGTSARNFFADEASPLIRHIPGGSLGGPILEDKLFIFGAYERQSDRSATLERRTVPTPQLIDGIVRYERLDGTFGTITDGPGGMLEQITQIPGDAFNPVVVGGSGILGPFRSFSSDSAATTPGVDNVLEHAQHRRVGPGRRGDPSVDRHLESDLRRQLSERQPHHPGRLQLPQHRKPPGFVRRCHTGNLHERSEPDLVTTSVRLRIPHWRGRWGLTNSPASPIPALPATR